MGAMSQQEVSVARLTAERRAPGQKDALMSSRTMPQSLAAEAAVLGSMIIDPECIGQVVEQVKRGAFYRAEHQMIFDALVAL